MAEPETEETKLWEPQEGVKENAKSGIVDYDKSPQIKALDMCGQLM